MLFFRSKNGTPEMSNFLIFLVRNMDVVYADGIAQAQLFGSCSERIAAANFLQI